MDMKVIDGIIVGAFGGAAAGVVVYAVQYFHQKIVFFVECRRVHKWLAEHTTLELGKEFRSTRTIASWNNITEDRARFICSAHKKIYLSTGPKEDMWGIHLKQFPRKDFGNDT
ncbi:hypothetical protein E0Z06_01045 [Rheinheimera sp. D18]|uniref:hypothetical protein n=1 Tax=Rheinheimera sp. D18 TaxID=2545632 RepID=UPI00104D7E12|nr:hypothetical protein [Rheinheimera sp. D18]QBL08196.1 hypothetical protein E0Z06_01045 [Rheinheimera sp. D18]